ncbi:MAG TPA: T9SS type A sorting domain-containing protein, partial [Pseudobacter sp.]|nr:T9SS type A sorting domain-containing protein [Pseudobacter sp.]
YNGNVRTSSFDVLVSTNGTSWTTASSNRVSSGTGTALETFTFTAVSAKYVRIVGHGNSVNLWNSYTEVKIQTSAGLNSATTGSNTLDTEQYREARLKFTASPNPFRGNSTISFHLDQAAQTQLSVFDITGRRLALLVNSRLAAGNHRVVYTPEHKTAGVYFIQLKIDGKTTIKKLSAE